MDVRQRNGGAFVSSQQRSGTENLTSAGRVPPPTRINSKLAQKGNGIVVTSCCFGLVIAMFIIMLGILTGTISVTDNDNTKPGEPQQQIRKMVDKESIEEAQQKKELELVRKKNVELEDQMTKMKKTIAGNKKAVMKDNGDGEKLQSQIGRFIKSTQRLKEMIQLISKYNLIQKYGVGPHYVEMLLSFDPQSNVADPAKRNQEDTEILLIQMAPISEMPATVYWFLEQINTTIFNGASFHRNAHHVVQGGVIQNFETKTGDVNRMMELIKTTGFDSIPFQEYSPNFPHVKYTLGYAGRPGGPDFYVSTEDNTRNHGPGGQASYEEASEADPCFAKVVPGYEHVVDRMHKSAVQPGNYMRMKNYVAIRHMRLLQSNEVPQQVAVIS